MSDTLKCPSCGGLNQLPDGINKMFCAFCGNKVEAEIPELLTATAESTIKTKPKIINNKLSLSDRKIKSLNEIIDWFTDDELLNIYTLDLSENEISSFDGINKFRKLSRLDLSYNKISEVDIFWNSSIYELNLCGNQISSLKLLESFKALERLDLSNNNFQNITDEDISFLNAISFKGNRTDLHINLESNPIASNDWINKVDVDKILNPPSPSAYESLSYELMSLYIYTSDVTGYFYNDCKPGNTDYGWFSVSTKERIDDAKISISKFGSLYEEAAAIVQEKQEKQKKKNFSNNLLKLTIVITFSCFIYYYFINKNSSSAENVIQPDIPTQDTITSSKKNTTTKKKKSNIQSKLIIGTWKTECTVDGIVKKTMTFYDDGTVKMETDDGELQEGKWQMVDGEIMYWVNEEYSTTKIKVDSDVFKGLITIKETGENIEIKGERVK